MSTLAWTILIGCAGLLAAEYCVRCKSLELRSFEKHADSFFSNIKPLLADDEVPDQVLEMIQFLNRHLDDGRLGQFFILQLLKRRSTQPIDTEVAAEVDEMVRFFDRRKELAEPFFEACAEALIAMTYRAGLTGVLLRRLVLFDVKQNKRRSSELAVSVKRYGANSHGMPQAA